MSNDEQRNQGIYCFICHKAITSSSVSCQLCQKPFHKTCLKKPKELDVNGACSFCRKKDELLVKPFTTEIKEDMGNAIPVIFSTYASANDQDMVSFYDWPDAWKVKIPNLGRIVDFNEILSKSSKDDFKYNNADEIKADIEYLLHNLYIVHGASHMLVKKFKAIAATLIDELSQSVECWKCYKLKIKNKESYFFEICGTCPHAIVWVKKSASSHFWPGKLSTLIGNTAYVRLFRTHERLLVNIKNCFETSVTLCPLEKTAKMCTIQFVFALEEVKLYLQNFKEDIGPYPFGEQNSTFDIKSYEDSVLSLFQMKNADNVRIQPIPSEGRDEEEIFTLKPVSAEEILFKEVITYIKEKSTCPEAFIITQIHAIENKVLENLYNCKKLTMEKLRGESVKEVYLLHGTTTPEPIMRGGFDERFSNPEGHFGSGLYFCEQIEKVNEYVFGEDGCAIHRNKLCCLCERKILVAKVLIGSEYATTDFKHYCHAPINYDSVIGYPKPGGLSFQEFVVYKTEQTLPKVLISYRFINLDQDIEKMDAI